MPRIRHVIVDSILRFAKENPTGTMIASRGPGQYRLLHRRFHGGQEHHFRAIRDYLSQHTNTEVVLLPLKSLSAYMERWFRSLKSESLDRMIFFGKRSLERAVTEYVGHYHIERNHQGLENELIEAR